MVLAFDDAVAVISSYREKVARAERRREGGLLGGGRVWLANRLLGG